MQQVEVVKKQFSKVISLQQPPQRLREFYLQFGEYLRDQKPKKTMQKYPELVAHIPTRVGIVYQELIYNNMSSFINQCFPICQTVITKKQWGKLSLAFFQKGALTSPYFTEINEHFVDFLYQLSEDERKKLALPKFFADLAHYEWVELWLDVHSDEETTDIYLKAKLNPILENLHYQWPVHLISKQNQPKGPEETFFAVYRDSKTNVGFMQTNAMTYALLAFMEEKTQEKQTYENGATLIKAFYELVGIEQQTTMIDFGLQLIDQLIEQQIILTRE